MVSWNGYGKRVCREVRVVFFWDFGYGVNKCGDSVFYCFVWNL